jgi:hypothetical protein
MNPSGHPTPKVHHRDLPLIYHHHHRRYYKTLSHIKESLTLNQKGPNAHTHRGSSLHLTNPTQGTPPTIVSSSPLKRKSSYKLTVTNMVHPLIHYPPLQDAPQPPTGQPLMIPRPNTEAITACLTHHCTGMCIIPMPGPPIATVLLTISLNHPLPCQLWKSFKHALPNERHYFHNWGQ